MKQNKYFMVNKDGKIEQVTDIGAVDIKPAPNQIKVMQGPDGQLNVTEYGEGIRANEKNGQAALAKDRITAQQQKEAAVANESGSSSGAPTKSSESTSAGEAKTAGNEAAAAERKVEKSAARVAGEGESAVQGRGVQGP